MKNVFTVEVPSSYPVTLEQRSNKTFRVTYGHQVTDNLEYMDAAKEFGACVFHALACAGKLDNED